MPGTVAAVFDAFRQRLYLPQQPRTELRILETVTTALRRQLHVIDTFLIGSCARGTACRMVYDVDIMVVLNYRRYRWRYPEDLLWLVRQVLSQELTEGDNIRVDGQAVTMRLFGTRVDVVPSFQTVDGDWLIPDTVTHDWILTNPIKHQELTEKTDQRFSGMFCDTVKMIKVWNQNRLVGLKGFHIELMAVLIFDDMPRTYSKALGQFFAQAPRRLTEGTCDPCIRNQRVDLYLNQAQRLDARQLLIQAANMAQYALDAEYHGKPWKAVGTWQALFGSPVFPKPQPANMV